MHKLFKVTYHITDYMRYVFTEISHSTMTTGNGNLVDKNFDSRDLENHLLQSFPQLMSHPVCVHACRKKDSYN